MYLAHTLSLYEMFYDIRNLLVLGRVASGIGGERIVSECQRVLNEEYPKLSRKLRVMLPDENFRRDRKRTRLNSSHLKLSRMPSSA